MDKVQIAFIMPPGYNGSLVFREMLFLLRDSFVELGYDTTIKPNQLDEERLNIVIGYHLLQYGDYLDTYRYIPYQLEQLDAKIGWYSDNVKLLLASAENIWDFSEVNIRFLENNGLQALHLPPGYSRNLEIIPGNKTKDIDVLFYGSMNERREKLLGELSKHVRLQAVAGVFGPERDELISRSKIVLNLHYYETAILESVRISYLLNNGCMVISEESADNPYDKVGLVTAPYERIIDTVRRYTGDDALREQTAAEQYLQFKTHYAMADLLGKVLQPSLDDQTGPISR